MEMEIRVFGRRFFWGFEKLHRVHINDEKTYAYTSIFFINQP